MLVGRLALFFGLLLAVAASQIPEYAQQYRQRLGGAIDELQTISPDSIKTAPARDSRNSKALRGP
jgi:hypothetical protein